MNTRVTSIILLLSMLASLTACGENNTADEEGKNSVDDSAPAGIEKKEYGEDFTVLAPEWGLYTNYFFSDEAGTDVMTQALYEREVKIEEHLGVTIKPHWVATIQEIPTAVRELNMSGDDNYQLVLTHCIMGTSSMITDKLLLDMNELEAVNFDADYYNHVSNENLSVNGHQYYAISDFMIPDPNAVLFNKSLIEELNLEDPYQLVRDGEWTVDNMMEMMNAATIDNGDGRWDINDTYGFGTPNDWYLATFLYSSGLKLVDKNEEGEFELVFGNNERAYTMAEKLESLFTGSDTYVYKYTDTNTDNLLTIDKGRSLFGLASINELHKFRDADVEFGILPYPMLDKQQNSYYSLDWSGLMCVPTTVQNPDMVGEVIELLAYYSEESVLPTYYDLMLGEKLSRDPESKEMLDLIFDNIIFDAGMNYFGFSANMNNLLFTGANIAGDNGAWPGLASYLAKHTTGAEAVIEEFNEIVAD